MSNNRVNRKVLGAPSNTTGPIGWVQLAEDAERDAEKACSRSKQLTEAATINIFCPLSTTCGDFTNFTPLTSSGRNRSFFGKSSQYFPI